MVLGVDVSRLVGKRTGIGRAYEYLLQAWSGQPELPFERVELYSPAAIDDVPADGRFSLHVLPSRGPGIWWQTARLGRQGRALDLLFAPSTLPLGYRGRAVVESHGILEGEHGARPWELRQRARSRHFAYSAARADAVVAVSDVVADDLVRWYGVEREKIEIVPHGISDDFRPPRPGEDENVVVEQILGNRAPFLIFVGKLSPRRHLPELLEAFDIVARTRPELRLLVVGPNTWNIPVVEIAAGIPAGSRVHFVEHLEHAPLAALYRAAAALVLPTTKEGWSLPIREALACGCPVVTIAGPWLDLDGAREAVLALPSPEPQELAAAIERVVDDRELRDDLRARGLAVAAAFPSHEQRARQMMDVLHRVALGRRT